MIDRVGAGLVPGSVDQQYCVLRPVGVFAGELAPQLGDEETEVLAVSVSL